MTRIGDLCPCKGCEKRWVSADGRNCHSECEDYKEWRSFSDKIQEDVKRQRELDVSAKAIIYKKRHKK